MKKLVFGFGLVCAACAMAATEITFTGADASNPTNLASAANWSAVPGADTVGVVSAASVKTFSVESAMSLSGLRFTGVSGSVKVGGDGVLTLGADGLSLSASTATFTLAAPVAIAADQTWDIGGGKLRTSAAITGSSKLTINNVVYSGNNAVIHDETLGYAGQIDYTNITGRIEYRGLGRWAEKVVAWKGIPEIRPNANVPVKWSSIVGAGGVNQKQFDGVILAEWASDFTGSVLFEDDDDVYTAGSAYATQVSGHVVQSGGQVNFHNSYFLTLGMKTATTRGAYDDPAYYDFSGGALKGSTIEVGYALRGLEPNCMFTQTGGTISLPSTGDGGGLEIAAGGTSSPWAAGEYLMRDGTLNLNGWGGSSCLGFCTMRGSGSVLPAACFTMEGGTVNARRVDFGSKNSYWNGTAVAFDGGYARLELSGGSFRLNEDGTTSGGPFDFRFNANWQKGEDNVYHLLFRGGEFSMGLPNYAFKVPLFFPKTDSASVWGSRGNRSYAFDAPISGTGVIRKEGTGSLLLADATRFTGTIDVREGRVALRAEADDLAEDSAMYKWTADSLVGTYADGESVTNWVDDVQGVAAVTNGNLLVSNKKFKAPKLKLDQFNGHAALNFPGSTVIAVPREKNPLLGNTKATVVAVFRITGKSGGSATSFYGAPLLSVFPGWQGGHFTLEGINTPGNVQGVAVLRRYWMGPDVTGGRKEVYGIGSRSDYSLLNDVHVAVATVDNQMLSLTVDGYHTNVVNTTAREGTAIGFVESYGWINPSRQNDLNFGALWTGADAPSLNGDIAEIRVYPKRAMSVAEHRQITRALVAKYCGSLKREFDYDKEPTMDRAAAGTGMPASTYVPPTPPATDWEWSADDLQLADGAAVESWTTADGSSASVQAAGSAAPTLVKNTLNGRAAVRFEAARGTALKLAGANNPVAGKSSFSVAVVYRTDTDTSVVQTNATAAAPALLSCKQPATKQNDFAVNFRTAGAIYAHYGSTGGETMNFTRKPFRLADGEAHVTVFSCDADGKTTALMTDGAYNSVKLVSGTARGAYDLFVGSFDGATEAGCFNGDIAAVALYDRALTKAEMRDLSEAYAHRYAFRLLPHGDQTLADNTAYGLGATNIHVAAAGTFAAPLSDAAPFVVSKNGVLSGSGSFTGSYRLADGAALDLSGETPAYIDDLQLAGGGVIRVAKGTLGSACVRRLSATGENVIEVVGDAETLDRKEVLFTFEECVIDESATWTVRGAPVEASVIVDETQKKVILKLKKGTVLIVR